MGDEPGRVSFRNGRLASRKAEEAALRRQQATVWLESIVGPLRLPCQPTEKEFVSVLRSGFILCRAMNKIQPGAVPKIIADPSGSDAWDCQALPAYQYFENIRNFLFAVEELKLPSFEASDLENSEAGSAAKIVDCVLSLKTYHEWKQSGGGNGALKYLKSPMVSRSAPRSQLHVGSSGSIVHKKRLEMNLDVEKQKAFQNEDKKREEAMDELVKILSDCLFNSKENIDQSLLDQWKQERSSSKLLGKILSSCGGKQQLKSVIEELCGKETMLIHVSDQDGKGCSAYPKKTAYQELLESQENEIVELREKLQNVRTEFTTLQAQIESDFEKLGSEVHGLSAAAQRYNQVVKENRSLYNMLQELRGNIRVFCRIRPPFSAETECSIERIGDDGSLMIFDPHKPQNSRKIFQFSKVFGPSSTQDDVYHETQSLIRSVMDGYNVCIFAYGQTGSGKTHTMCGSSDESCKDIGINYMALNDLFDISRNRENINYEISVQMVEIYNEQVRDLLAEDGSSTKLDIRICSANGQSLPDANMLPVQSTKDVINIMRLGENNRSFSSTAMNNRSSRSHSILTVHVKGKDASGDTIYSSLHLVDLAGSERVDRSEATGDRLKEAQHINKSLSCLGDVITALSQKNAHIPFRNSKLTQLLQNSLGGDAKMLMLAHVSPEADSYGESLSTLKFAQRASTVELGTARMNKESGEIRDLKEQIDNLKRALATNKETERTAFKMQEDVPTDERTKRFPDRTPPRSRRLSIENGSNVKSGQSAKMDSRKAKSSVMKSCTLSRENVGMTAERKKHDRLEPNSRCTGEPLKEINDQIPSMVDTVPFYEWPSNSCNVSQGGFHFQQGLLTSSGPVNCPEDFGFSKSETKSFNNSVTKKGSNIKKSIQTIGKLINGYERRYVQHASETASPNVSMNYIRELETPSARESKLRRRQSLTNTPPNPNVSRRSSLGGKSDTCTNDMKTARTPPVVVSHSSAKGKRWA